MAGVTYVGDHRVRGGDVEGNGHGLVNWSGGMHVR
jgi:hypothetical protein